MVCKIQYTLLAASVVFFLLVSCQKEANRETNPTGNNTGRVKSYTEAVTSSILGNSTTTYNLSYDEKGRMISMVSASSPGDKFVYAFPSATKFTMDLYNGGSLSIHEDFYLTADTLVDSTFQYNHTRDSSTEKYTYNAARQLVSFKQYEYSRITGAVLYNTTTFTYDASGNVLKAEATDGSVHMYEYYPDLSYAMPVVFGPLTSHSSKKMNLVKKHTFSSGLLDESAQYTYTFDSKNRISTEKMVISDGGTVVKTYTYF